MRLCNYRLMNAIVVLIKMLVECKYCQFKHLKSAWGLIEHMSHFSATNAPKTLCHPPGPDSKIEHWKGTVNSYTFSHLKYFFDRNPPSKSTIVDCWFLLHFCANQFTKKVPYFIKKKNWYDKSWQLVG